jgi:glycosyltransferase involved in cell wall biosynthesis
MLSIVVPCFNEQDAISIFYKKLSLVKQKIPQMLFELIFVNDGSVDNTENEILKVSKEDDTVKLISFTRNFGKEAAIYAGLKKAQGNYLVLMDVDSQDPPELLPEMISMLKSSNVDCVATKRTTRKGEPIIRTFFAKLFYKLINKVSDTKIVDGARDYRIMSRKMVNSILEMHEYHRFSKGIFDWLGFKTIWISYENIERSVGDTKWSFWKLLKYGVEGIVAFTTLPLRIASIAGLILFLFLVLMLILITLRKIVFGDPVAGWASTVSILLFLGSLNFFFFGIIGEYVAKIYMEVKRRPIYVVKDTNIENRNSNNTNDRKD